MNVKHASLLRAATIGALMFAAAESAIAQGGGAGGAGGGAAGAGGAGAAGAAGAGRGQGRGRGAQPDLPPLPPQPAGEEPRTVMERRNWAQFTPYDSMITYLTRLQARSKELRLGYYGETWEGRKLPYVVLSRPLVAEPWEAAALGKPIIVLNTNVHGGERTLRESLLILLREMSTAGTPANRLLDDIIVVAAPQINPDGFGLGDRGNLWGIDLNRDYIKLEQPEIAAYVGNVLNKWHPHIVVDGHNGCAAPYNICYQSLSHADPDQRITEIADKEIFPAINARLAPEKMSGFYYQGGNATRWTTGGWEARIGRNYGGFSNNIGILFESPGQPAEQGVKAGILSFKAVLEYAQKNPKKVVDLISTIRRETIALGMEPRGKVVVQQRYGPEDWPVTYQIRAQAPDTGWRTIKSDSLMKKPIATLSRDRPYAYLLPRDARDAVAMLRRHGITVEELTDTINGEFQAYRIGSVQHETMYNHAAATVITVDSVLTIRRSFPKGTFVVRTGQMMGRVVTHMLEVESDDNVIYWNTMDAWIPRSAGRGGAAAGGGGGGGRGGAGRGGAAAAGGGGRAGGAGGAAAAGGGRAGGRGAGAVTDPDAPAPAPQQAGIPNNLVPIFKVMTARPFPARIVQ